LVEILKIFHIGETKANRVEMFDVKVALAKIANRVLDIYNTNERWVVKKMRLEYANKIIAILLIIY
jgi:hypothetical protein